MVILARKEAIRPIIRTEQSWVTIIQDGVEHEPMLLTYETGGFGDAMAAKKFHITDLSFDFVRTIVPVAIDMKSNVNAAAAEVK